jgi:hypothetical protein
MNSTALLQESPGSDRETIETYSLSLSDFSLNPEITCTTYTKQMHNQKTNIHEHINNLHRETTPAMNLNQNFILLIQHLYMGVLHNFSACSSLLNA